MQDSRIQEEEGLDAKTTQHVVLLRLGSTTSITTGKGGPTVVIDFYSACGTMKRHSPSTSSMQQPNFDDEEPRCNKIILVDPSSCSITDNEAAAGAQPKNSTVTAPPPQQEQPQFQFSAHSSTRSVSGSVPFNFYITPATTAQGQGTYLGRSCSDDLIAPPENNDDFDFFRAPAASRSIPASLVGSESMPTCELLPSFSRPSNTALTSPEATLPQRRPSRPCPAPAPILSMTRTKEKTGTTAMTEPKDSLRSSELGQTGVYGVALPESAAEKRLIRMKKRVEDMQKWLQEEEADISAEDRAISTTVQNLSSSEEAVIPRSERERGVTIETEGRGFGIYYCCNCGKNYQVHISLSDLMTVHLHENTETLP